MPVDLVAAEGVDQGAGVHFYESIGGQKSGFVS
jgi:hypothetical protein